MRRTSGETFGAEELLGALGQAVIATTLDGTVEFWSHTAEQLYGWTAEEALGKNIRDLCVPELALEIAEDIMESVVNGASWTGGFPVRCKDGSMFPALVTDSGIYREGRLVGLVGVSTNIGSMAKPFLERSTDAALMLRSDAVITYASSAVRQLFGWDDDALLGESIVPLIHPEDRQLLASLLDETVSVPGAHAPVELRVLKPADEYAWAEVALTNLLDDPVVRGVVCNLRLSARREALEIAEERAQQLQTALDSRVVIEQAKGYLIATEGVDPDEAFQLIRDHARRYRLRTHDVCRSILAGEGLRATPAPSTSEGSASDT